ncbi:hypothetical protein [Exiguobacterium flavidum]|uniref:hypothetical protein n=1 Tax=Exiguobacterium flavidum TaxID=2184695 RepID=UPI000DF79F0C|nr:hypothetical protein [Exiguobacterium flavidum]
MGYTNKSNKMYAAAAALAVTASAVAPIAANAATPAVASIVAPKHIVHYGGFQTAVKKLSFPSTVKVKLSNGKYATRSVTWEKPSFQSQYMNKYQVLEGKVEGTSKKAYLKLLVKDYIIDVSGTVQVEQGKAQDTVTATVTSKSGKTYQRQVAVSGINSSTVGHKGSAAFEYTAGKNQVLTGSFEYAVVENKKAAEYKRWVAVVEEKTAAYEAAATKVAATPSAELLKAAQEAEFKLGGLNAKDKADFQARLDKAAAEIVKAEAALATPEVKEVKAINLKQVKVTFNKELDAVTSVNTANYLENGTAIGLNGTAELQEDGKSVIITFTNAKAQNTAFSYKVTGVTTKDAKTIADATFSTTFADAAKPTVTKTEYKAGKVVLTFSEPLATAPTTLRVNGNPVNAGFVTGSNQQQVEATVALSANTTANLYAAGGVDAAGVTMDLYNGSVNVPASDVTKPHVVSATQVSQNVVRFVYNEALGTSAADLVSGDVKVLKGATVYSHVGTGVSPTISVYKNTIVDPTGKTFDVTVDLDGTTNGDGIFASGSSSQALTFLIDAGLVADAAGNQNDAYTTSVTLVKDSTGPVFASSKVNTGKTQFELSANENLVAGTLSNIIVTDAKGVRYPIVAGTGETEVVGKVLNVDLAATGAVLDNGTYTIKVPAGTVTDALGNTNAEFTTTVTVGAAADSAKPVAAISNSGNNVFRVTYTNAISGTVDEVGSSALLASNYKLDGAALPAGTDLYFTSPARNVVEIVLPSNSINIGAKVAGTNAVLSVSGVTDLAGNVVDTTSGTVKVADNTAATLQSAQLLADTLVLTFSENLDDTTDHANITTLLNDLEIKSGNNVFVAAAVLPGTTAATATSTISGNKMTINIVGGDSNWSTVKTGTLTVKTDGALIEDANDIVVKDGVSVTVAK